MTTDASREQFLALLERHRGIVLKVASAYCRHTEDRHNLAQEISAQAWKAFAAWDSARSFSTWLYRIALNVAISFARSTRHPVRQAVALDELDREPGHDDDASREADDGIRALYRFMAQLDALNRALPLLYLDEKASARSPRSSASAKPTWRPGSAA